MKFKLFLLLGCILMFASCQDNDKMEILRSLGGQVITGYEPCTELSIGILDGPALTVSGVRDWSVVSDNEEIVEVEKVSDPGNFYFRVLPRQRGSVMITVTGDTGEQINLPVSVGTSERNLTVVQARLCKIEGVGKADSLAIGARLFDDAFIQEKGNYKLYYTDKKSGDLTVTAIAADGKATKAQGTFISRRSDSYTMTFNGKTIEYSVVPMNAETGKYVTRSLGPVPFFLEEDFTEQYRVLYPTVTKVLRAQKIYRSSH